MVKDMRSRMNLFVAGSPRLSSKERRVAMLIRDMDISRLMLYEQQVKEEELRDREEFRNKKVKTGNESGHHIECPKNRRGSGNSSNRAQSSSVAAPDRAAPRGATSGTGGRTNRLYAITRHQEQENSPNGTSRVERVERAVKGSIR
ncbi:uncharacterized protein LOC125839098 [Solanum verrucosum]|uniref:uncharacterized protein LOC125839098 n=1 Tax=Solanum verrucosum TaxID=315347 RepID=UPI0020CFF32C|nr:uncharacterized protein LOC125839098 [Solanum verrucosum]